MLAACEAAEPDPPPPPIDPPPIFVPSITGSRVGAARLEITSFGLEARVARRAYSSEAAGTVLRQRPPGDTEILEGATVFLTVSRGFPLVPVQLFDTLGQARTRLRDRGYGVRVIERTNGLFGLASPGEVIDWRPFSARPGSTVTLIVAPGAVQPGSDCHSSYTPCVPIASDVDCGGGEGNGPEFVYQTVQVIGPDIYDLDHDGDGFGCD